MFVVLKLLTVIKIYCFCVIYSIIIIRRRRRRRNAKNKKQKKKQKKPFISLLTARLLTDVKIKR